LFLQPVYTHRAPTCAPFAWKHITKAKSFAQNAVTSSEKSAGICTLIQDVNMELFTAPLAVKQTLQ
jgi:hypothetical protein